MANKTRIDIPQEIAALLLFQSDRTCCKCCERGKSVQIHHIDENPSNNAIDNLAVLCLECHDETQIRGGFGRKLDALQVVHYRTDWHIRVQKRRDEADKIASAKQALPESTGETRNEKRDKMPHPQKLINFVHTLPAVRHIAYERARPLWDTGGTPDQKQGCYDVSDVLEQILVTLTSWYPKNQFSEREPNDYINGVITSRYLWHRSHMEPLGGGTGGTIVGPLVAGAVLEDLERMITEMVDSLHMHLSDFDFVLWKQQWEDAAAV